MIDPDAVNEENARLRAELRELQNKNKDIMRDAEAKIQRERSVAKATSEEARVKTEELGQMKNQMVRLTRQLDDEVARRDQVQLESQQLERKLHELAAGGPAAAAPPRKAQAAMGGVSFDNKNKEDEERRTSQVSTKLMRVIDTWMRQKDLQAALLRGAAINDQAFSTLVEVLKDCPLLATLELSQNHLTMDSISDVSLLITSAPSLSFVSVAENKFALRSIGYFMIAIMERQGSKKLMPLDLLDMTGNEGLIAAAAAPPPESLLRQVNQCFGPGRLPPRAPEMLSQVMRALWRFLHDTNHPQVRNSSPDEVTFNTMDKVTLRKMENALMKILLMVEDAGDGQSSSGADGKPAGRNVTANLALAPQLEQNLEAGGTDGHAAVGEQTPKTNQPRGLPDRGAQLSQSGPLPSSHTDMHGENKRGGKGAGRMDATAKPARVDMRDPFADLKNAFEPPKERQKFFNLKQIINRNGQLLPPMLERILETSEIDARDHETDQTLLEFACHTGNMGLAKLCWRKGSNLRAFTKKGKTPFNIVTEARRYDFMEFLHTYGVRVNDGDASGITALHVAAKNDDVDAICRLIEWGADVNLRDHKKMTPLHTAAKAGNWKATMLLLEMGAEMNAKDSKQYTAVAYAEEDNHFKLMDRLKDLGGKGHGLSMDKAMVTDTRASTKPLGELPVSASMLKSSSLGRIGRVVVKGLPNGISPTPIDQQKKA